MVLVVGVGLLAACGDDSGGTETSDADPETDPETEPDAAWPGDGGPTETFDLGEGLVAELPEDWEVEPFEPRDPENVAGGECAGPEARLDTGAGLLSLELNPQDCDRGDTGSTDIGNGDHGTYVALDDVPEPQDVEEHDVGAGSLTTFVQAYYECTNECNDYDDNVGLLELEGPPDPNRPTVVLLDAKGELPMEGLVAVAEAIRVESTTTTTTSPATPPTTTAPPEEAATTTSTAPEADEAAISLNIEVTADDQQVRSGTLECGDAAVGTGHLADAAAAEGACDLLDGDSARNRLVDGYQPPAGACTMIYGGPDVATVTGTVDGQSVDTSFSREDGCAIADFDGFEPLIGSASA